MKALVLSIDKASAKNGTEYLRVRYSDEKRVEKSAVMFAPFPDPETVKGNVCELTIRAGTPSDKIESLQVLPGEDKAPFVRQTKFDVEMMIKELKRLTRGHGDLTKIVDYVIFNSEDRLRRMKLFPAATHAHHAFQGGLLEHTYGMMKAAEAVLAADPAQRETSAGVVLCAIALHDVGKMFTYNFEPGQATEHNQYEHLLGHIVLGNDLVTAACREEKIKNTPDVLNLRHCILSHHGKKEWGSPVMPTTREAVLVHQIDMLQSRGEMAYEGLEQVEKGKVADMRHPQLDNVYLVKL